MVAFFLALAHPPSSVVRRLAPLLLDISKWLDLAFRGASRLSSPRSVWPSAVANGDKPVLFHTQAVLFLGTSLKPRSLPP